jgi:hypothetical protein
MRRLLILTRDLPVALAAALAAALIALPARDAAASAEVAGTARKFVSPAGVAESCVMLARMPGAAYREADTREEEAFCEIDLHGTTHALCPKLFSTSPGTLIHDLTGGPYAGNAAGFEREVCPRGQVVAREAAAVPISFKMSVNTGTSSATFANAALLYYHYARYLDAAVHVPPAVLRTMDREAHRTRVAVPGERESGARPALRMNHAGWSVLAQAENRPESYPVPDELFTPDRRAVYGVLLHPRGRQYGEEVNGSRRSGWGEGQSRDFQQTAPFVALRSPRPLDAAIADGLAQGHAASALPAAVRREQMVFWMRELIDIVTLDFIFGQQDRVGNIDYLTYWYWVEDGRVRSMPAQGRHTPDEIARFAPKLLKRTELSDNDAGVRTSYLNFTKRTGMLDALRHYDPATYRRLLALAADFEAQGPLWNYTRTSFGLSEGEFRQIVANTREAAAILRAHCAAGRLRFDLDPEAFLRDGAVPERKVDCERP